MSKLYLLFLLFLTSSVNGLTQSISIIVDLTYDDDTAVPFEYAKNYDFKYHVKSSDDKYVAISSKWYPQEYYNFLSQGYEEKAVVILDVEEGFFTDNTLDLRVTVTGNGLKNELYDQNWISKYAPPSFPINNVTYESGRSINMNAPEKLSLSILNDYINDKLFRKRVRDGGFLNIVNRLRQKYALDSLNLQLSVEEVIDFNDMYTFVNHYANENAFYQREAALLQEEVNNIDSLLSAELDVSYDSLVAFRNDRRLATNILREFNRVNQKIQTLNVQLENLLLLCSCVLNAEDDSNETGGNGDIDASKRKFRTDLSIGLAASFGGNSRDQDLYFERTDVDFMLLEREVDANFSPSLSLFMTHYLESERLLTYGLSTGIGANFQSLERIRLGLFLGGTLIIGKSRRTMVHTGLSLLSVRRLNSPPFDVGDGFSFTTDLDNISSRVFKASPFIAVSYNLRGQ